MHSSTPTDAITLNAIPTKLGRLRLIYGLSVTLTVVTYILVSIGALVRSAGAGLSCPDWPLCYAQLVPTQMLSMAGTAEKQIFAEWFHRLIASSVSFGLLGMTILVVLNKPLRSFLKKHLIIAWVLLAVQVVLGGLTVIGLLSPKWVVSHLGVGLAFFGVLLWITLRIRTYKSRFFGVGVLQPIGSNRLRSVGLLAIFLLYGQIILGGLVSANYAGLACLDFPTCDGQWLPPLVGLVKFQFIHRVGAIISTVGIIAFVAMSLKHRLGRLGDWSKRLVPMFLTFQILLGVGMIFLKIPLLMSVAHLAVATLLLGMVLVMNYEIRRSS